MISTLIKLFNEDYFERRKDMGKTALELYSDYKDAKRKLDGLDKKITERLMFLCKKYPEAVIDVVDGKEIKAETITYFAAVNEKYPEPVRVRINYIAAIEGWLRKQNPSTQLEMFN